MATLDELERAAEAANGLPSGMLGSIRQQETGGKKDYIDDPAKYHYGLDSSGRRIAGHTGKVSTAFGPYGILESTGAQPGYGVQPLRSKALEDQVEFAASYLAGRSRQAGSVQAGLAGYGEGDKYANQVLKRIQSTMTTSTPTNIDTLAANNVQRNDVAAQALEQTYGAMSQANRNAQAAMGGYGEDSSLVVKTKALGELEARNSAQQFAAKIGTDPSAASFALNKLVDQSSALFEREQRLGETVARQASTEGKSFFGALIDRALLPQMVREFNTVSAMRQSTDNRIATLNQLTQTTAVTQNAIANTVTTESALAMGRMAQAEAATKVAGLEIEGLKQNATGIIQVAQMRNSALDIGLKRRDQELQEASVLVARQNAALQSKSMETALADRTERLNERQEDRAGKEQMLALINLGRKTTNLPPISSMIELTTQASMDETKKAQFSQQYSQGLIAAQTGRATVAETPWDAAKYVKGTGSVVDDGRAKVFGFLDKVISGVSADPKIPVADRTKEKVISAAVNAAAIGQAKAYQTDVTSGGSDNIYRAPPTETFLRDPEFAKTYMAQKILAPMKAGGMEALPVKEAVSVLMQHMAEGKIPPAVVDSELGFLAEKSMAYNNELYRYKDTAGLPNMTTMGVRLEDSSSLTNAVNFVAGPGTPMNTNPVTRSIYSVLGGTDEKIVNLANPVERSDFINRRMSQLIPPVLRQQSMVQTKTGAK